MSCMLCNLTHFTEQEPPEGVDLFVCSDSSDITERYYGIMQFFKKGSVLPEIFEAKTPSKEERIQYVLNGLKYKELTARETGYYFLDSCNDTEIDNAVWLQSCIPPLDSLYAVINPEDM